MTSRPRIALFVLPLAAAISPLRAQDTAAVRQTAAGILIDFQDIDLRTVITALAEVGGLNVSYGEIPARRTTLRLHQPIGKADVLPLLKSVAAANGLQMIQDDRIIRLQAEDLRAPGVAVPKPATAPESRLFVYRLRHARAVKLAATLQAIFGSSPSQGQATPAGSPRNSNQPSATTNDSGKNAPSAAGGAISI